MIPKIFIENRDYVYIWLKKNHGENYAKKELHFRLGVYWSIYYAAFIVLITLLIVSFKPLNLSKENILILKTNFFVKLIGGGILFFPYYIWLKSYLFPILSEIEINENIEDKLYKKLQLKAIIVFILGFLLILFIGALNNLLKFGHF